MEIDDLAGVEGPAFVGNYCAVSPEATIGAYSVLGANVRLRERASVVRSVIDQSTFVGRGASVEGAIVGKSCDLRSHVHIHDGAALGDGVTVGAQTVVMPDVRIFPHKDVESGATVYESLVWEGGGQTHLFGREGVSGVVNVDLTPEAAVRLAAAFGTTLQRGARVVASRDATPACRMIKRAMVSGLTSTGISIADLRVLPAPVNRHAIRTQGYAAGFHVGMSVVDPEQLEIRFFEHTGTQLTPRLEKEVEKHYTRYELRRAAPDRIGKIGYPVRVRESYAGDLLGTLDAAAVIERRFRIVVDYGQSAASFVLPLVLGPLEVEAISAHEFAELDTPGLSTDEAIAQTKRLVEAVGADLGAVFDLSGERLFIVAENAQDVPSRQALLLFLRLLQDTDARGSVAFPVTVTSHADRLAKEAGLDVVRTPTSPSELMQAASQSGMVFAAGGDGAYVIPDFQPSFDAMAALCKLLELLAPELGEGLGAGGGAAGSHDRRSHGAVLVGTQGSRHARAHGAPDRPRSRSAGRDQGVRQRRLGHGEAGSGRAARARDNRNDDYRRLPERPRAGAPVTRERSAGRAERRANLKLRLTLGEAACFNTAASEPSNERSAWKRSPISRRCRTPT